MDSILADVSRLRMEGKEVDARNTFIDSLFGASIEKSVQELRFCIKSEVTHNTALQLLRTYSWDIIDHAFQLLSAIIVVSDLTSLFCLILLVHEHERIAEWEVLTFDLAYQTNNTLQFTFSIYMIQLLLVVNGTDRLFNKALALILRRIKLLLDESLSWMDSLVLNSLRLILGISTNSTNWQRDITHTITTLPYPTPNTHLIYFLQQLVALFVCKGVLLSSSVTSSISSVYVWMVEGRWAEHTHYSFIYRRYAHSMSIISSLQSNGSGTSMESSLYELLPSKHRQETINLLTSIISSSPASTIKSSRNKADLVLWSDILSFSLSGPASNKPRPNSMDDNEDEEQVEVLRPDALGIAAIFLFITCNSSSSLLLSQLLPMVYNSAFIGEILMICLHVISASISLAQQSQEQSFVSLSSYELTAMTLLYPQYGRGGLAEMEAHLTDNSTNCRSEKIVFIPHWRKITSSSQILDFYAQNNYNKNNKLSFQLCQVAASSTEIWTFLFHFLQILANCHDEKLRKIAYFSFRLFFLDLKVVSSRFLLLVHLVEECPFPHIVCFLIDTVKDYLQLAVKKISTLMIEEKVGKWKENIRISEGLHSRLQTLFPSFRRGSNEEETAAQLLAVHYPITKHSMAVDDVDFQLLQKAVRKKEGDTRDEEGDLWSVLVINRLFLRGLDQVLVDSLDQVMELVDVHICKLNLLNFICLRLVAASSVYDAVWMTFFEENALQMTVMCDVMAMLQAWHSRLMELQSSSVVKELSPLEDMKLELLRSTVQFAMRKCALVIAMIISAN